MIQKQNVATGTPVTPLRTSSVVVAGTGQEETSDTSQIASRDRHEAASRRQRPLLVVLYPTDCAPGVAFGYETLHWDSSTRNDQIWAAISATREVVIIGEEAESGPGRYEAERCAISLRRQVAGFKIVYPPPNHYQLSTWVNGGLTHLEFEQLIRQSPPWTRPAPSGGTYSQSVEPYRAVPTARQLIEAHPTLRRPVIDGLTREGEVMNLIAPSKVRKSWLICDLLLCAVTGRPWLGRFKIRQGRALLIDNELHEETIGYRLQCVAKAMGLAEHEWLDRIHIESMRGRVSDIFKMKSFFDSLEPGKYVVTVLDALYRTMPRGADENDNGQATEIFNALDQYAEWLRTSFISVHHASKGGQSGKAITDVGSGAGVQSRAVDTHMVLRPHAEPGVVVADAAIRSFAPVEPFCLRWDFPLFKAIDDLDPADLLRNTTRGRQPARQGKAVRHTPAGFVQEFVTATPQNKDVVIANGEAAGLSERESKRLLKNALRQRLIYEWKDPSDRRKSLVATVPSTAPVSVPNSQQTM